MQKKSIRKRIVVNSAAFLFVVTAIILSNIYYFKKLNSNNLSLVNITYKLKIQNSFLQKISQLSLDYQSYSKNLNANDLQKSYSEFFNWFEENEKKFNSDLFDSKEKEILNTLLTNSNNLKMISNKLLREVRIGASSNELYSYLFEINNAISLIIKSNNSLMDYNYKVYDEINYQNMELNNLLQNVLYISLAVMFVAFFFITTRLISKIDKEFEQVLTKLYANFNSLLFSSNEVFRASDSLSTHGLQFTSGLQETISSISEVSAMVQKNTDTTVESSQLSKKSKDASIKGKVNIDEMIQIFDQIIVGNDEVIKEIDTNNKDLSIVVEIIKEIEEKTKIINEIVFHTKLLSFNASVEAARAGDKGKGFAVVAEEVGNLATMSGKAAKEITNLLASSTEQVAQIVTGSKKKMDNISAEFRRSIESGQLKAKDCAESFKLIEVNIDSVDTLINQITSASKEQNIGIKEITHAIQMLDKVNHENNKISGNTKKLSSSLKNEANNLNENIDDLISISGLSISNVIENVTTPKEGVANKSNDKNILSDDINESAA